MPSQRTKTSPLILFAFACVYLCWGSTYVAIHIAALHIAPPLVGALRSLFSTLIILIVCLIRGTSLRVPRRTAWRLALVGILLMSVNNVLLIWAETKVATGYASLVIAMTPIFVALIETALPNGETLSPRGWIGTLLGALGISLHLWPSLRHAASASGDAGSRTLAGFAILLVAALAFASGSVLSRRFHFQVDTFVATAWQIGAAGLRQSRPRNRRRNLPHRALHPRPAVAAIVYLSSNRLHRRTHRLHLPAPACSGH